MPSITSAYVCVCEYIYNRVPMRVTCHAAWRGFCLVNLLSVLYLYSTPITSVNQHFSTGFCLCYCYFIHFTYCICFNCVVYWSQFINNSINRNGIAVLNQCKSGVTLATWVYNICHVPQTATVKHKALPSVNSVIPSLIRQAKACNVSGKLIA